MTRNLAARIERLEAAKRSPTKVRGVIGGLPAPYVEEIDGVLYLRRPATPTGEPFADFALKQQSELLALLRELGGTEDPQNAAPEIVGTVNSPAPLKSGQKARNFIHLPDGTEIRLKRN